MLTEHAPADLSERLLFRPIAALLDRFEAPRVPDVASVDALLGDDAHRPRTRGGQVLRFASVEGPSFTYESRVYREGIVATRPGSWHDFFNALVWIMFPRTKAALNAVHCWELPRAGLGRGARRDAATQFDESGAVVASADAALLELLRTRRWRELFWERRADVGRRMRFFVFGHGLYDSLRQPFIGLCAKAITIEVGEAFVSADPATQRREVDERCAAIVADARQLASPRTLVALPVLGIPGVVAANERAEYYEDARQFRGLPGES